ncbi:MAG: ABC transporter ATP-binding protein [Clostridia bacterium]|nr:ABC transporter ATP-binding protein [Clostridia bacterium]
MSEPRKAPPSVQQIELRPGRGPGGPMGARLRAEKPKNAKRTLARLLGYIGRSKLLLLALLVLITAVTLADLFGPRLQQAAIDAITIDENHLAVDLPTLFSSLIGMGILFATAALLSYVQGLLSARLAQDTVYTMRRDLFSHMSRLPISYTDRHRHGDLMSRMTNDVENVSNAVSQSVTILLSSLLTIIGAVVMMLTYSPLMTLFAAVTIPLSMGVSSFLAKFTKRHFVHQQKLLGQLNGQVEETVSAYATVMAYGKESDSVKNFSAVSNELRDVSIRARVFGSVMGPVMNFIGNLQYVLIAGCGGALMLFGTGMTVGTIQAMLQYSKKFSHPINQVANQYSAIMTALAGAERIFEIMDAEPEIDEGTNETARESIRGEIVFRNVHFSYVPGEEVLRGLNLTVKPGQKIAIVGATGSGKTTVVNLLMRFYEPDSGEITVDGIPLTELPKATLRHAIGIVLQDTVLFADTVDKNIRYGREGTSDEDVREAARHAHADGFIERMPDGYQTKISESGENLSKGQRQLLTIARAVLADPKILILDEATSSVDTRTEMHIQGAMLQLMKNRTSLVIAHRLSTIRDADCIVVMRDGVIAEAGNHDELLSLGGEYSKLYRNQFAGIAT